MSLPRRPEIWVFLAVLALSLASPALAQAPAQIVGTVQDATGLALPGVVVTIRGAASRTATTGSEGQFDFQGLPPGDYELTATLPRFARAHQSLRLAAGQQSVLTLKLVVQVLEQTIVTAAKSGEADVQKTPMAVSALSGTELSRLQVRDVSQLAGLAPTVTFSQNSDFAQLTIRGIGTNVVFAGSDPSSAVYLDGVYLARPVMVNVDFLDLERVEVLRGPQGTLYGRNAVGGAVNIVTKAPTNDFEVAGRVSAGNDSTFRTDIAVSGPIVRGRVMGNVAFLRAVSTGTVNDVDHPDHPLGGQDVTAVRGQLHVVFNRRSDLLISGDLTHQDPTPLTYAKVLAVKPGFTVDNPAGLHNVRASTLAESRTLQYGIAARLNLRLRPTTTLSSLTAYRNLDYNLLSDADITELELTTSRVREFQHQVSEEATLTHDTPRIRWLGGLFLFKEWDRQPTDVGVLAQHVINFLGPRVEASSAAVFGQATVRLNPRLSATAGLRFTYDQKTINNTGQRFTLDLPRTLLATNYDYMDHISNSAWTPKFGLEWQATDQTMTYVSVARGFKTGGFNLTSTQAGRGFAPEWAWSTEAGIKTMLGGGRARVNVATFYTDYTNLQVQTAIIPGVIDIANAAAATITGVEVEGTTRLGRGFDAGGYLAWLHARYDRYIAVGVGNVTGDAAGNALNNAPDWSGRVWLEWDGSVGRAGLWSLRADSTWQTTVFYTPFNDTIQLQRAYGLLSLSARVGPHTGRWSVEGYMRNVTNQDFITGSFGSPPPAFGGRPGDPRQAGIQLAVRK